MIWIINLSDIKTEIDIIKSVFYKKKNEDIETAKAEFIKEGGKEEDKKESQEESRAQKEVWLTRELTRRC